jgi:hypothetical protein
MKTLLWEILLILEAVALWILVLPVAAILFAFALLWKQTMAAVSAEAFGPPEARFSRASA